MIYAAAAALGRRAQFRLGELLPAVRHGLRTISRNHGWSALRRLRHAHARSCRADLSKCITRPKHGKQAIHKVIIKIRLVHTPRFGDL